MMTIVPLGTITLVFSESIKQFEILLKSSLFWLSEGHMCL